jgi:hypothetical protein
LITTSAIYSHYIRNLKKRGKKEEKRRKKEGNKSNAQNDGEDF